MKWLRRVLLNWDGRIGRKDFWLGLGLILGLSFAFGLVTMGSPVMMILFTLAMIYPTICLQSQRLHDLGRSGWWQVAVNFAGGAAGFSYAVYNGQPPQGYVSTGQFLVWLPVWVWLGSMQGQPVRNMFGDPPGGKPVAVEVF